VTDHLCAACAQRPAPHSTICRSCTDHLVSEVAAVGSYHGLAYDLDIATAKLSKFRPSPGGRSFTDERPLLIDEYASDAAGALKAVLSKWAKVIHRDTHPTIHGPTCRFCRHPSCHEIRRDFPVDTLAGIATWLRRRVRWIAGHPDAARAYAELCGAVRAARIAVDRPGDRVYVGACDEDACGRDLYARPGDRWAVCRAEVHEESLMWPVDARREWLLQQAADFVGTTKEVSAALSRYARPVTPAVIRGLHNRGAVTPVSTDARGRHSWRLGDVLAAVTPVLTSEKIAS
jgi:hypothetical protein